MAIFNTIESIISAIKNCRLSSSSSRNPKSRDMPYSFHSHSGQFCSHGEGTLEEIVRAAIEKRMQVLALTEHMPRDEQDLYPEEIASGQNQNSLQALFDAYIQEATRLQNKYRSNIEILIGFEAEWIRPSSSTLIKELLQKNSFDLFIGSVHHVHTIPIDYNREMYIKARSASGGTDERIFNDYFDSQYQMLKALKPPIVGHFDLIRLRSDNPDFNFLQWRCVKQSIIRNLDFIVGYGGVLELNSAALRKGMAEPYPAKAVCELFLDKGGRFTFADDSHGISQVGGNYGMLLQFAESIGITSIERFEKVSVSGATGFPKFTRHAVGLQELKSHDIFE